MNYEDYIADALDMVSAWEVPEEDFAQIVNDQARLMCGTNLEPSIDLQLSPPYAVLRF
jgi:ferredoxin